MCTKSSIFLDQFFLVVFMRVKWIWTRFQLLSEGYRETQRLSVDKIVRSIKLTWWKEATVLEVEKEDDSIPLRRFQVENKWVADNWNHLNELYLLIYEVPT